MSLWGSQGPGDFNPPPIQPRNLGHRAAKITVQEEVSLIQKPFEIVLSRSRVYDRVKDREVDGRMTVSTTRSHAWSVLSGLSLAAISVIAVIHLPLYVAELERFRKIASPSLAGPETPFDKNSSFFCSHSINRVECLPHLTKVYRSYYGLLTPPRDGEPSAWRLQEEWNDLQRKHPLSPRAEKPNVGLVRVEPMDVGLVRVSISQGVARY